MPTTKRIISIALVLSFVISMISVPSAYADSQYYVNDTIDYSEVYDISGYKTAVSGWSSKGTSTTEIDNGTLKWTTKDFGLKNSCAILAIPLKNEIDTTKGEFTVSIRAKLPNVSTRRLRGFGILSDDTTVSGINATHDNLMGITQLNDNYYWLDAGNTALWMEDKNKDSEGYYNIYTKDGNARNAISVKDASESFYTYKWVVNPQNQTFRFYYQKDGETSWVEPYANYYMKNTNTADENDLFDEKGVLPTGNLPQKISTIKFRQYEYDEKNLSNIASTYIKSINVRQSFGNAKNETDYSKIPDISEYKTAFDGWSKNGDSSFEIKDGVLEWTTSNFGDRNTYSVLTVPLENTIDTSKGEFTVSIKAKLPNVPTRRFRGFGILSGNSSATFDNTKDDNLMGLTQLNDGYYWIDAGNTNLWMEDKYKDSDGYFNIYTKNSNDRNAISVKDASESFYTYKYVINPQKQTFRFYFQKEGETTWIEPYADFHMKNTDTADENDLIDEKGTFPTGTLPTYIKSIKFRQFEYDKNHLSNVATTYIKSISVSQNRDIYVSANGSDLADGSYNSPLKTLEKAVELYKENSVSGTIYIFNDINVDKTIVLDESLSGLKISSYNNAKVTLSGGYTGGRITHATEKDLNGKLPKSLIGKIVKWDISGYSGLNDDATALDHSYYSPELTDNGQIKTIARWPDKGWSYTGEMTADKSTKNSDGTPDGEYVGYEFITDAPIRNMTLDNAKINGFWAWDYRYSKGKVLGYGESDNTIEIQTEPIITSEYNFSSNRRYYLYNIPEEITSPGEYYIDYNNKFLYYYPEDINNMNLSLTGIKDSMFKLQKNCNNVEFYGISFENVRGTAISGKDCNALKVDNCRIQNVGGRGIYMVNTYNTLISRTYFNNIGDSSVEISGGDVTKLVGSNSKITDCEFANGARIVGTYAPFVQLGAVRHGEQTAGDFQKAIGINVENNYFHGHMHSAIIFDGNDFIIKNNVFEDIVNATQDAGVIYSRYYATYRGNEITNNIFRNIRTFKKDEKYADVFGIYMDDLVPDVIVKDNLFENCSAASNFGGGQSHTFSNNMLYDCYGGAFYTVRTNRAVAASKNGYLYNDIKNLEKELTAAGLTMDTWYNKYPNFKKYCDDVQKYADALASGIVSQDDDKNENYDILHITGEKLSDNIFIAKNAPYGMGSSTTTSSKDYQNANYTHNYLSDNLDEASIDDNVITLDSRITSQGFGVPDVACAGVEDKCLYVLNSGKSNIKNVINSSDVGFGGYVTEDFDGYNEGESVKNAKFVKMTGNAYITSDGMLNILSNNTVNVGLPVSVKNNFAFEICCTGKAKITAGGYGEIINSGTFVFRFNYDTGTLTVYEKNNGNITHKSSSNITDAEICEISITAVKNTSVDYIGFSEYDRYDLNENILDLDFENAIDGNALETAYDNSLTYCAFGYSSAVIKKETDGGNVLKISDKRYNQYSRTAVSELFFTPIKAENNIVNIEYKVKQTLNNNSRLQYCVMPVGYNADNCERAVNIDIMGQDAKTEDLKTSSGVVTAKADELKNDYINFKYEINKSSGCVIVYKKNQSNEWQKITQINNLSIPDYINKLLIGTNTPIAAYNEYLFDDIKVYTNSTFKTVDDNGNECEPAPGKTVYVKPQYIPGTTGTVLFAAIYNKTGDMVYANCTEYKNGCSVKLILPNDYDETKYNIKRFVFESVDKINPILKEMIIKINQKEGQL